MIIVSIGSNLGNRLTNLRDAVNLLDLKNKRCSIVLETECILPNNAPASWNKPFLNMIVSGDSDLSPQQFLHELKKIEHKIGRPIAYERWSPRIIDLDILYWDDQIIDTEELTIPHPEIQNRPFLIHLLSMFGDNRFLSGDASSHRLSKTYDNSFSKSFSLFPKLVGIVNATTDSFSDGGLFDTSEKSIMQALKLNESGAAIIEIGAQSTRPGATIQGEEAEYATLKPVLEGLKTLMDNRTISVSVDTFWPSVIHNILENYPISWINDVKGDLDDDTLRCIAQHNCKLCIMHSLGVPPRRDIILPYDQSPINMIIDWASKNIDHLLSLGFKEQNIIIDPGIGFGKSMYQNIEILRNVDALKSLGMKILIGHSRKSYIETFAKQKASNRDIETIGVSAFLENKVDFLRVHNVEDHMRFFVGIQAMRGFAKIFS